ncbi:twin-arginine translocase TatA/TatE family subunit [Paracoccus sp. SMMA_5_TC]|nr:MULTISPECIES: twin-arginine translocase TatA/TatE family subunit [unclassified Paracoccus (in: a-proteobacteria)]UXU73756.1 twin-arginine translocase TatA/TatE family subunit [Paracoccus sp. SMMA_5]UXU79646.1 twin-arginine translocase TatA/TatE family subunit [Paracoccus sp. SMMA_5_TC]
MLNNIGLPGLLLIAVVVLVLFGRGKVSSLMGEVGKGITAFKKGVKDGAEEYDRAADEARKPIAQDPVDDAARARSEADARLRDVTPRDADRP